MNLGNEYFPIYKEVLEIESFESFTSQIVVQNSKTFYLILHSFKIWEKEI